MSPSTDSREDYTNEDFIYMCKLLTKHEIVLEHLGSDSILLAKIKDKFQPVETIYKIVNSHVINEQNKTRKWVLYNDVVAFYSGWSLFKETQVFENPVKAIIYHCVNLGKPQPQPFKGNEITAIDLVIGGVCAGSFYCHDSTKNALLDAITTEYKEKAKTSLSVIPEGVLGGERRNFVNAYINKDREPFIYAQVNGMFPLPTMVLKTGTKCCNVELKTISLSELLEIERKPFHHTDLYPESTTLKQLIELSERMNKVGLVLTPEQENKLLHDAVEELSAEVARLKLVVEELA